MAPYVIGAIIGLGSIVRGLAIGTAHLQQSLLYIGVGAALLTLDAWIIYDKSRQLDE